MKNFLVFAYDMYDMGGWVLDSLQDSADTLEEAKTRACELIKGSKDRWDSAQVLDTTTGDAWGLTGGGEWFKHEKGWI
jgi:hypothetical protein